MDAAQHTTPGAARDADGYNRARVPDPPDGARKVSRRPRPHRDVVGAVAIWCFALQGLVLSLLLTALKFRADSLCDDDILGACPLAATSSCATVLMLDVSHSMVLYGEDRITPARTTALALAELITTRYPKDTLDIVAFGTDAWEVSLKELPYLQVGPYYTNTREGLRLARRLLERALDEDRS